MLVIVFSEHVDLELRIQHQHHLTLWANDPRLKPDLRAPRTSAQALDSAADVCNRVQRLGYRISQHVRLYGEEFEIVSEPFVINDGIAIRVRTRKNPTVRTLQLPSVILQTVLRGSFTRAS